MNEVLGTVWAVLEGNLWDMATVLPAGGVPDVVVLGEAAIHFLPLFAKVIVYVADIRDVVSPTVRVSDVGRWGDVVVPRLSKRSSAIVFPNPICSGA